MGFANADEQGLKPGRKEDYKKNNSNSLLFWQYLYFLTTQEDKEQCKTRIKRNQVIACWIGHRSIWFLSH